MAALAAPSLQHLHVEILNTTNTFSIPHLCRFTCDAGNQFHRVHLDFSDARVAILAEMCSKSIYAQPFRIIIPGLVSLEEIGNRLSGPLATVEILAIVWKAIGERRGVQWRKLFNHTRKVKFLLMSWQVALDVADSFHQDGQLEMELLPALEIINLDMTSWHPTSGARLGPNSQDHATIPDAFEPLIATRKKVGRPITLSSSPGFPVRYAV